MEPKRSNFLSLIWRAIGVVLAILGIWIMVASGPLFNLETPISNSFLKIVGAVGIGLGVSSFNRGRKYVYTSASQLLSRDKRSPILYLRSFESLEPTSRIEGTGLGIRTELETLAQVMKKAGPFIAIAKPDEKLAELGIALLFVKDDEWQTVVKDFMKKSRLVVIRAGDTDGLWWEVEAARELVKPEQLLILLPFENISTNALIPERYEEYENFRRKAESKLGVSLPLFYGKRVHQAGLTGIIYFDTNWHAYTAEFDSFGGGSLKDQLEIACDPVFKQLKIKVAPLWLRKLWANVFQVRKIIYPIMIILLGLTALLPIVNKGHISSSDFLKILHRQPDHSCERVMATDRRVIKSNFVKKKDETKEEFYDARVLYKIVRISHPEHPVLIIDPQKKIYAEVLDDALPNPFDLIINFVKHNSPKDMILEAKDAVRVDRYETIKITWKPADKPALNFYFAKDLHNLLIRIGELTELGEEEVMFTVSNISFVDVSEDLFQIPKDNKKVNLLDFIPSWNACLPKIEER